MNNQYPGWWGWGRQDQGTVGMGDGQATDDPHPGLRGTLSRALSDEESVRIYDREAYLGDAVVTGTSWTFTDPRSLVVQEVRYTAFVADEVGNRGAASNIRSVTVDTEAPIDLITSFWVRDSQGAFVQPNAVLHGAYPMHIGGPLDAPLPEGSYVSVYINGEMATPGANLIQDWPLVVNGETYEDHRFYWHHMESWAPAQSLPDGTVLSITARIRDAAGNEGPESVPYVVTLHQPPQDGLQLLSTTAFQVL